MGEDGPGDTRMLYGERDGRDVHMPALLQPSRPGGLGIGILVDDAQVRPGGVHQQGPQVPIAPAGDLPEAILAAGGVLSGVIPSEAA